MARFTAFSDKISCQIEQIIPLMAARALQTLDPYPAMTYDSVLDMMQITGKQREFMRDGRSIIDIGDAANKAFFTIAGTVRLHVAVNGRAAPLIPKDPKLDEEWLRASPIGLTLLRRAEQLKTIAREWGTVLYVFDQLNTRMNNEAQVRYVWPSVLALMAAVRDNEAVAQKRDKLLPLKVPQSMPAMSVNFRALIRQASTTVSMWNLLPPAPPASAQEGDVQLSMAHLYEVMPNGGHALQLEC